jgi:hypothetical protein
MLAAVAWTGSATETAKRKMFEMNLAEAVDIPLAHLANAEIDAVFEDLTRNIFPFL